MNTPVSTMLYLPIETKTRDLEGRLFVIFHALKRGIPAMLLHKSDVKRTLRHMPGGTYIHYGAVEAYRKEIESLSAAGHRLFAWDEEGLVFLRRQYSQNRISPAVFASLERFFSWGSNQRSVITETHPDLAEKVLLTGHPRFDLLKPNYRAVFEPESALLRKRYGRMILINTRFGFYNHFKGKQYALKAIRAKGYFSDPSMESYFDQWIAHDGAIFDRLAAVIPKIAAQHPDHTIVLRPHPSENIETWKRLLGHLPNFTVVHEGNVINWIMAADVMVHSNCTTGVEAYLLDRPSLAYRPVSSEEFDPALPNALSIPATTDEDLLRMVGEAVRTGGIAEPAEEQGKKRNIVEQHIEGFYGTLSTERIIEAMFPEPSSARPAYSLGVGPQLWILRDHLVRSAKAFIKKYLLRRDTDSYADHKFPGTDVHEIDAVMQRFMSITGTPVRYAVRRLSKHTFLFEPKG